MHPENISFTVLPDQKAVDGKVVAVPIEQDGRWLA
jgi:hypothetical protein